jgi:orotate phosphoribosyltransferase
MNATEVRDLYERHGVLQGGHFVLSSGRHSDTYLQCARVLEYPKLGQRLGEALAARFREREPDVVVSPAIGAILIGYAVALELGCRFLFTERSDGATALRRGQALQRGERALVIEDVVTTGGSAAEVVELIERAGASVAGVGALVDRSESPTPFRLEALLRVEARSWSADRCPMCRAGDPITTPGSRHAASGAPGAKSRS